MELKTAKFSDREQYGHQKHLEGVAKEVEKSILKSTLMEDVQIIGLVVIEAQGKDNQDGIPL